MTRPTIICIDDQREVLATLRKDLTPLRDNFSVEFCESAAETEELLDELDSEGQPVALLICDHVMPGKNGVDFLIGVNADLRFRHTRKMLLTGQATHQDTITAINEAGVNRYIEKPWTPEKLLEDIRALLTEFVINEGLDYRDYISELDQPTLYRLLRERG